MKRVTQMSKHTLIVTNFRRFRRGTLFGWASVYISELRLTACDVAVHRHASGAHWVALPARPVVSRDGVVSRTSDGRIQYAQLLRFDSREVSEAFSKAVVAALLRFNPNAFDDSAA